jgi:hypothetical protein
MIKKEINLESNNINTPNYILDAVYKIKNNLKHDYSEEEVKEYLMLENDFRLMNLKSSDNFIKLSSELNKGLSALKKSLELIAAQNLSDVKNFAKMGWYISPNLTDKFTLSYISEISKLENVTNFENKILENSDFCVLEIINNCKKENPKREPILNEILQLYKNGFYFSLINICYSQVDGICNDVWGIGFFDKFRKSNILKSYTEFSKYDFGLNSFFVEQLNIDQNEITMWWKHKYLEDEKNRQNTFNRHHVIHGYSTNYGNKKNAVRAVFLLDFISYFLKYNKKAANVNNEQP